MKKLFPEGPFLTSRRKLLDLLIIIILDIIIFLVWSSWEFISLFTFGYIWNWVASQELPYLVENQRYRFSMVKFVKNLQVMIQKPLVKAPGFVKWFARILPAGLFWTLVIHFNSADMPWWATFLGSFVYEAIQLEVKSFRRERETGL